MPIAVGERKLKRRLRKKNNNPKIVEYRLGENESTSKQVSVRDAIIRHKISL